MSVRSPISTYEPLFPCDTVYIWLRSTSGMCSYIAPLRTLSRSGSPGRSTSSRSRRRRCWCRCRRARAYPGCRAAGSSRRIPAMRLSRRGLWHPEIYGLDYAAAVEIYIGLSAVPCAAPRRSAALAPPGQRCAPWPVKHRRSGPSTSRPQSENWAAASSKSSRCTSRTCRGTCTPVASPSARAVDKTNQSNIR